MIRTFLTTTALTALMTAGAFAQDAVAPATDGMVAQPFDLTAGYNSADTDDLATRILGAPVYSSAANDAQHFGDINDLVIDDNGDIRAVIIGVGGFLGVGEKNVAVDFSQLELAVAEDDSERWILETTQEALNAAPAFEFIEDEPATDTAMNDDAMAPGASVPADGAMAPDADVAVAPEAGAMAPADDAMSTETDVAAAPDAGTVAPADEAMDTDAEVAQTPAVPAAGQTAGQTNNEQAVAIAQPNDTAMETTTFDRSTMTGVDVATLTADELIGTRVVGPDSEQIAEVGDLVLTEDGQIDAVLVDFGGFLGIGEKRVAVAMDNLEFLTDTNGFRYVFLENITREQLEAAPAYDQATYATDRDNQRLTLSAM